MAAFKTGSIYISACRQDRDEITTAFEIQLYQGIIKNVARPESGKSRMAASKPEVPIFHLLNCNGNIRV